MLQEQLEGAQYLMKSPFSTDLAFVQAAAGCCLHSLFYIAAHAEHQLDVHIRLHIACEEVSLPERTSRNC